MRREILYSLESNEAWAAVVEDDEVVEVAVEREGTDPVAGDIISGVVRRVLPGMQAAFVDIGADRSALVHAADVPAALAPLASGAGGARPIGELLREGQRVIVQITKEALADKGARATLHVSLPGRLLVLVPAVSQVALSRRIAEPADRERLLDTMRGIAGAGEGWIVRTAGVRASREELEAEASLLRRDWTAIARTAQAHRPPRSLRREEEALGRFLRDLADESLDAVVADDGAAFDDAAERIGALAPAVLPRLRRHDGPAGTLLGRRGVLAAVERALRPKVRLPSGGTIVISQTEALVAIDVNTARFVGGPTPEATALETDLEAAREIARQIRLRNLGGIIVIDFIDLEEEASRRQVVAALAAGMERDRSPSRLLDMSSFGLVQITRRRGRPTLDRLLMEDCFCCRGTGRVKSPRLMARDLRASLAMRAERGAISGWIVRVHPAVAPRLAREPLAAPGTPARPVRIEPDAGMPLSRFSVEPEDEAPGES